MEENVPSQDITQIYPHIKFDRNPCIDKQTPFRPLESSKLIYTRAETRGSFFLIHRNFLVHICTKIKTSNFVNLVGEKSEKNGLSAFIL